MRRAYISSDVPHELALPAATRWVGAGPCVAIAPSTSAVQAWPPLERSRLEIGVVGNRRSKFTAHPHGTVVAWCLNLEEILEIEGRTDVDGIVATQVDGRHRLWITAHDVERIDGAPVPRLQPATPSEQRLVRGLSCIATLNQGLIDRRERDGVNQALLRFSALGIPVDPDRLAVEAIRRGWPGHSPLELAQLARAITNGKTPRATERFRTDAIDSWATGCDVVTTGATEDH